MIKMCLSGSVSGGEPRFWEANWQGSSLEEALRFCEQDPLRRVFERHVPEGSLVLEGGCGPGQYVVFYGRRGRRVVGLDFAASALHALKSAEPRAVLCRSDVASLPFLTGTFDAYFSGGVVEHFEEGPERALAEALRVLREDGRFLVSVPYANPIRRTKAALGLAKQTWLPAREGRFVRHENPGAPFWQYAFTRAEFGRLLEASGFRVLGVQPYALLWGLYEVPGVARLVRMFSERKDRWDAASRYVGEQEPIKPATRVDRRQGWFRSLLHRVLVEEDTSLPIIGRLIAACARVGANMIMFICIKQPRPGGQSTT